MWIYGDFGRGFEVAGLMSLDKRLSLMNRFLSFEKEMVC